MPAVLGVSVIETLLVVTVLPLASCTVTVTSGAIGAFAIELVGCTEKASFVAGPDTLNAPSVAAVIPVADARS